MLVGVNVQGIRLSYPGTGVASLFLAGVGGWLIWYLSKPDIAMAHALAAEYLGMQCVYLDAGSGADQMVPTEMVEAVCGYVSIPLIVGGGIRRPEDAGDRVQAGASYVVIGSVLESERNPELVRDFAQAVHAS